MKAPYCFKLLSGLAEIIRTTMRPPTIDAAENMYTATDVNMLIKNTRHYKLAEPFVVVSDSFLSQRTRKSLPHNLCNR